MAVTIAGVGMSAVELDFPDGTKEVTLRVLLEQNGKEVRDDLAYRNTSGQLQPESPVRDGDVILAAKHSTSAL